MIDRTVEQFMN